MKDNEEYDAIREEDELDDKTNLIANDYITETIKSIQKMKRENLVQAVSQPKKLKKPFKVRFKEFVDRITNTIS